ncbi:zinc finger protein 782-like isoform X7 [Halichoerus grypus]
MNTSPVSVSFKDVTVESTQEEGQKIGRTQRTLYREVMLEIYSHLVSMDCSIMLYLKSHHHTQGYCYTKPEVILRLDQAEDPCLLEKEFLIRRSSELSQKTECWKEALLSSPSWLQELEMELEHQKVGWSSFWKTRRRSNRRSCFSRRNN